MNPDIKKVGGILIQKRKLLIARKMGKDFFMSPGGKIEPDETEKQALVRELFEEFGITVREKEVEEFDTFTHPVVDEPHKTIEMTVFLVHAWDKEPRASNEIEEIRWVTSGEALNLYLASIFAQEVVPRLRAQNLID